MSSFVKTRIFSRFLLYSIQCRNVFVRYSVFQRALRQTQTLLFLHKQNKTADTLRRFRSLLFLVVVVFMLNDLVYFAEPGIYVLELPVYRRKAHIRHVVDLSAPP